jgi:hypothetical protein
LELQTHYGKSPSSKEGIGTRLDIFSDEYELDSYFEHSKGDITDCVKEGRWNVD